MTSGLRVKLVALVMLVLSLAGSAFMAPMLAADVGRFGLVYTDRAEEGDPPQVALGIAMGAFRGIFVNYLWLRANDLKEQGRFHESIELAKAITRLQPRFPRVWAFQAWNLSYNVSVATQTPQERWQWVSAGIELLRDEGIPANPNDMLLHKELAWIYLHKIGGYTDDANQYYKRQIAVDWQETLGAPPVTFGADQTRDAEIQRYVDWLSEVEAAPKDLDTLLQDERVRALWNAYREITKDEEPSQDLLQRYTMMSGLKTSVWRNKLLALIAERPKTQAVYNLYIDPQYAKAWPPLVMYARRNVIENEKHMSVKRMIDFTKKYGPIDWRLPAAHALYWSASGVEQGLSWARTYENTQNDFVNTDRITLQALQELWRGGTLDFNYLDYTTGLGGYYLATNNANFIASYGQLGKEIEERGGIFESDSRVHRQYAAGYENFLIDAIIYLYRRRDFDQAQYWYRELRTFDNQNMHDQARREELYSVPLSTLVERESFDRWGSPNVAVQNIIGSLQGAYISLVRGNNEAFEGQFEFAAKAHAYYFSEQFRKVVASNGTAARMEWLDRDFRIVAGQEFARFVTTLPLEEAATLYARVPNDLRRYAFDALAAGYAGAGGEEGVGLPLDELFPEPEGMDAHRARELRKMEERKQGIEGINQQ